MPGEDFVTRRPVSGTPRESRVPVRSTDLYAREVGVGTPIVILHGGPSFDHRYLLPEMDMLADSFRLIYYDQRGRGSSLRGVVPQSVTLASEVEDVGAVREHFCLDSMALLGHSFGTLLALEYALRNPTRVSQLILMNPAPASADDWSQLVREQRVRLGHDADVLDSLEKSPAYLEGDPDVAIAALRIWFRYGLARQDDLETLLWRLRAGFTHEGIVLGRGIAEHLFGETLLAVGYDLHPKLPGLRIPTLVISGDHEIVPRATPDRLIRTLPNARLVTLVECGHFPHLESPESASKEIAGFLRAS